MGRHETTDLGDNNLRPMVTNAPPTGRDGVRGSFFQTIFERVCNDTTIVTAVNDLGIPEPERSRWIASEQSFL